MKKLLGLCIMLTTLSGCNLQHLAYDRPFTQGNQFGKEEIAKLTLGMNEAEVIAIMGSPVLTNVISRQEWDYVYYQHRDGHTRRLKTIILHFEEGKLATISPL